MKDFFKFLIIIFGIVLIVPAILYIIVKFSDVEELDVDFPFDNKDVKPNHNESSLVKKDSLSKIKNKVEKKSESILKGIEDLSERQKEVYNYIMKNGEVEMAKLSSKFDSVSSRTLRRDLTKLVSSN